MSIQIVSRTPFVRLLRNATSLFVFLTAGLVALAADTGRVAGTVVSKSTGNALQGAQVAVQGRLALTDESGRFVVYDVPAGAAQVLVVYSGFKDLTSDAVVTAGAQTDLTLTMETADIVQLEAFTVQSVREGQALSVTEQRNAVNTKNVVALDEWGVLPTQNVGELFTRMPGVGFTTDEDNLINNITVRGLVSANGQSFTRLNIDGMSATGVGGNGRTATLHSFSAAMYEQLEVIAGQTPDKRADAIGGQINLKTRSPLAQTEKRRVSYNLSGRYLPPTSTRITDAGDHPYGYAATLTYSEVFDFAGGKKNLGVQVNLAKQQVVSQFNWDFMQYRNVGDPTQAYFRDYDKRSGMNHRFIDGFSVRADYRWRDHTTVSARFLWNDGKEPFFHYTFVNPFVSDDVPGSTTDVTVYNPTTNPNGTVIAGSNQQRTEFRISPTGNNQMLLTPRRWSFMSKNPTGTLAFEHDFNRLKIDHSWRLSKTRWDSNSGARREGGQLNLRTKDPIGFVLDNREFDGRVFTQTAGPSIYDPASYTSFVTAAVNTSTAPVEQTSVFLTKRFTVTETEEWSGNVSASYELGLALPITIKAGLDTVNREVDARQIDPRRWYLRSGQFLSGLPLMPVTEFEENHGGQRLPVWDPVAVSEQIAGGSSNWYEDVYYNAVQKLTSKRYMQESVDSAYVQAQTKLFKKLTVLAGVRFEKADVETGTYFNKASTNVGYVFSTTEPDPYKRARANAVYQTTHGEYTKKFPSLHLAYDLKPNLKLRASWSTSYGRPDLLQLVPAVSVNDTAQSVTIGNPDLKPQMAKNIDLKLEYYFKNSGIFTVSVFQKRISDYLPGLNYSNGTVAQGPDNGFDGNYGGYTLFSPRNIGAITMRGLEIDYKQRLTMLPGALKGLTVRGNASFATAEGDLFFTAAQTVPNKRNTKEIPGVLPTAGNFGLQYTKGKFGASFDLNYTSEYADSVAATLGANTAAFNQLIVYRKDLLTMSTGISYRLSSDATLYLNVNNLTEQGSERYLVTEERWRQRVASPMSIVFGVTGTF